ncbi:MAG: InlB B-repeat-containing protein [Paludibacteraceae bacterium]
MMKHTKHLLVLWAALLFGAGNAWGAEGIITFGNNNVKINSTSVTGNDDLGNSWTITTVGTTSFTGSTSYYQVGSSSNPATSITFTTTLASSVNITAMSAEFGGFSGTAGTISLKVGDTEIGSGSLNAANDVTVSSTQTASGTTLTVTITGIAKGVKCYNISYTYSEQTYSVQWMVDGAPWQTTQVNEGAKATPPTGTPTVPTSCSEKVFVGWSSKNIGTTPTDDPGTLFTDESPNAINGDSVFYAVFATETTTGGGNTTITYGWEDTETYASYFTQNFTTDNTSITAVEGSKYGTNATNNAGNNYSIKTNNKYKITSVEFKYSKTSTNTTSQTWVLQTSTDGNTWTNNSTTFSASGATKGEWSTASWTLDGTEVYVKITMGTSNTAQRTIDDLKITYGGGSTTTYSDYITQCSTITYIVTYDANGGTCSTTSDTYTGTPIILPTPTRDGYRFDGWEGGGTRVGTAGDPYIPGSDITLTAQWTRVYTVTYDINGGTGTTPTETPKEGLETFTLARESAGFSKPGYKLAGWEDNLGNQYLFYKGGRFDYTVNNFDVTLTAIWEVPHTVTYDLNGGTGTVPTETDKLEKEEFTLAASDGITKPCHTFKGWSDGTKTYDAGVMFWNMPNSDITFTAVWEALPTYTVTFKANETDVFATQTYCSGDVLQLPATDPDAGTYACAGYTFVGWASDEQSTETTTCPTLVSASTPITADATFHAVWKKTDGSAAVVDTYDWETTETGNWNVDSNIARTDGQGVDGGYAGKINTANTYVTYKNKVAVTSFSFDFKRTTTNSNYNVYIETSTNNTDWTAAATYEMSSFENGSYGTTTTHTFNGETELYVRFHCYNTTAVRYVDNVSISYGGGTTYYTTSPKCCPVNLQNPVVSTSVADGSVTLNWTMSADEDKVTDYTVTCVGGVTEDVTGTTYTFTGLTNCTEYTFTVRANGDGTAVCPSEVVTVKATPAADSFTVTFDYGAGAGTPASWASGCGNGTSVTLPEPTTLPDNHTFEGWYDGTTLYASGDTYTPTADITLTARYTKKAGVDVVEWDPNSVTVEIGVGGAAQVQIENKVTSGSGTGKVADNLFFSKYYESTNSVKLLAVFNGTAADIDLSNFRIRMNAAGASTCNGTSTWSSTISLSGILESGKEYIIYSPGNNPIDAEVMSCAETNHAAELATWHIDTKVSFSGNDAIILEQKTGSSWDIIDIIGAGNASAANLGTDCSVGVVNAVTGTDSFMDANGWYNANGESIEDGSKIALSTNRCLLVRKNTVTSGAIAVAKNKEDFVTLGGEFGEWAGKQIPDGSNNGVSASCEGFDFVGTYDYNGYYTTYQELTKVDLGGNQNDDGTYTIQVSGLNDISCSKIRINVLNGSSSSPLVSSEYKVPIMVNDSDVTTTNAIFTKHAVADCSECDVVVLKGATLEKAPDGTANDRNEFRDMEVYAGGKLKVPASATDLKVNKLVMRSKGDEVPVAEINGTLTIADKLYHAKRIDAARFYFFTLPYDCNVADITYYNGEVLSGNGDGYLIKYYDGAGRAIGQNAGHWEVYTGSLLEAGKGYIVAISASLNGSFESNPKKELLFPMTNALSETTTKTVAIGTYGVGDASIGDNHKGWNLIGCPFMSNYSPIDAKGLKVGTYEDGTWDDGGKIFTYNPSVTVPYVTMPNTDGKTYTQKLASSQDLQPFRSFFVQVGKEGELISDVAFSSANRKAPRKAPAADAAVWVELTLSNASGSDATTVIVDDDKTTDYEIGADLEKMLGYAALPQFYSLKSSTRLAFNALPSASASSAVPLGFYAPASDTYTIAMNTTQAQNLEGVYLTDNVTGTVTNLLLGDYSFTSGRTLNDARFSLAVVRSVTAVDNVLLEAVTPVVHRRTLRIDNAPVGSLVRVYDTLGREVVSEQIDAETVVYQLQMPGVYHVQIITKDSKSVYKVVSY